MKELAPWLWIAAIAVIFWLLIIRPASRRQKEAVALQEALSVGDDIVLTSGIFGTIVGRADDHLEVSIAPGVVIHVVGGAVASVRRDVEDESSDGEQGDAADDGAESTDESGPETEER